MKTCITCGMPLEDGHSNDIGLETADGPVCIHDTKNNDIKSGSEIFEGGVQFFMTEVADGNREFAERLTRKNMNRLPYWQHHPFEELKGMQATDQEFDEAMSKL